mmetsp:Transcript_9428/g.26908  ORF Transcript_9428/g.26908 Transcript_9428/m.26908 type:complete len:126 (+) Transcript_9428:488-865(+)
MACGDVVGSDLVSGWGACPSGLNLQVDQKSIHFETPAGGRSVAVEERLREGLRLAGRLGIAPKLPMPWGCSLLSSEEKLSPVDALTSDRLELVDTGALGTSDSSSSPCGSSTISRHSSDNVGLPR